MAFLKDRKKLMNDNRKRHFIRQWLSSLAVTTVVVVAAVIAPSSPPNATFERIGTFDDAIYYDVVVTDTSSTINPETLKIIVESQFEQFEIPLEVGFNTGMVEGLRENTKYDVLVIGSRGYGSETLVKESLTTVVRSGGAILSVDLITSDLSQYELEYEIRTKYLDLSQLYQSVTLSYCIDYHEPHDPPLEACIDYIPIDLTLTDITNLIYVPNYNLTIYLVLEATNSLGDVILLDSMSFKTPLNISGSLYINDVTNDSVKISAYVDFMVVEGIEYYLELYEDIRLIDQIEIAEYLSNTQMDLNKILINQLKTETTYQLHLRARFIHPQTSVQTDLLISYLEFTTTPIYEVIVSLTEDMDNYYIDIEVDDPSNILHQFNYIIYDVSGDYPIYITEMPLTMTLTLDNKKVATFSIIKPIGYEYEIRIVCNKVLSNGTTYYSTPLYIITNDLP